MALKCRLSDEDTCGQGAISASFGNISVKQARDEPRVMGRHVAIATSLHICCCHSLNLVSGTLAGDHGGLNRDYALVTPVEVDSLGRYVTHDVTRHGRSRRSLPAMPPTPPGPVHYRMSAFGRDWHLELTPSAVLAPGFTVQTLGSEGIATEMTPDPAIHGCLYQGIIRNHTASSAAISTCAGLVSLTAAPQVCEQGGQ
ncbi:A disintegrin and metalloproteinase with thrombospondin motifs 18-like [Clupea harengus]|uniref:A disintegrin and metalloproteinase with thrombospondin motifs 18-like n=1 Tax=Clupea harengus TaxID=7950 RepID=A0A8M1KIJ7_CLUHA|nr:A disintegrin and metalloproteinase with thrombospondin motifs 18-like [Clupea harengus]